MRRAGLASAALGTPLAAAALALAGTSAGAAAADSTPPVASRLAIRPQVICLRRTGLCRRPGATISFNSSEAGDATLVIMKQDSRVGTRRYGAVAGANRIHFDGRVNGRRLRQARYRLLLYVRDRAGNELTEPPIAVFAVRPVAARHYWDV